MANHPDHGVCVDTWMRRVGNGVPADRLIHVFERDFGALWRRAHQTLGDITLTAIADRVLYTAAEQFPFLASIEIDPVGLRCQDLRDRAEALDHDLLVDGIRFVVVEFLTVLGNLTAQILTDALHAELSKARPETTDHPAPDREDGQP
jgi:hypothetical protein